MALQVLNTWKSRLHTWGYEPLFCSVESKLGLDSLLQHLRDQTTVIVGPSGVGKSSLINALRSSPHASDAADVDNWFEPVGFASACSFTFTFILFLSLIESILFMCCFQILGSKWFEDQRVGEVSTKSGRGKHTTRHVSLLPLSGGGYLADTPGFNQPSLLKVTKQSLAQTFPEVCAVGLLCMIHMLH